MDDDAERKIEELEKRIFELERTLVYHWHSDMGASVKGKGAAVWFESMGEWHK